MSIAHSPHTSEPQERVNVSTVGMDLLKGCLCLPWKTVALPYAASVHHQHGAWAAVSSQKPYLRFIHKQSDCPDRTPWGVGCVCMGPYPCENLFQIQTRTVCVVSACFWPLDELGTSATVVRSHVLSSDVVSQLGSITVQSDIFVFNPNKWAVELLNT